MKMGTIGMAALAAAMLAAPAPAQAPVRRFDLPAQPASRGIPAFARAAGVQIVASGKLLQGRRVNAVRGAYPVDEALRRLLAGTGLVADRSAAATGIIMIREAPQGGPAADRIADADDIVVTARKRAERSIEVPIALTAMRGAGLEKRGVRNLADVLQEAPGVGIMDGGNGVTQIAIRGISTALGSNENGYYLDELPFTGVDTPISPDVRAWDLDRIEVLRGPQGTLFGEGSMGGTVRILTQAPVLDGWEVKGMVTGGVARGGDGDYGAKAAVNLPLAEGRAALRLVGTHEKIGGWIDDGLTGRRNVNDQRIDTFRAKLRIDPVERLSLNASYWRYDSRHGGPHLATDAGMLPLTVRPKSRLNYELIGVTARYDLGGAELFYSFSNNRYDLPLTTRFVAGDLEGGSRIGVTAHEGRIASTGQGPLKWTAGYYRRTATRRDTLLYLPFDIDAKSRTSSATYALFGEATWTALRRIDLTAGLRYFHDRLNSSENNAGVVQPQPGKSYRSLNPRFSIAWRPDRNATLYATVAKGFRSGMTQSLIARSLGAAFGIALPDNLKQDSLWSYELGGKADLMDGLLMLEGAVYHARWKDVAALLPLGATGLNGLINSRGTRTTGVEFNAVLRPAPGLGLTLSGAWTDARYVDSVPGTSIVKGGKVSDVARVTLNGAVDYQRPIGDGLALGGRIGFQHNSRRYLAGDLLARPGDPITRLDARLSLDGRGWSVAIFGENLTNEDGAVSGRNVTVLGPGIEDVYATRLRPLTVGVALSFDFKR